MERFAALFGRFLQEEGPSVDWNRIEKLPADAVMDYATLSAPTEANTVSIVPKQLLTASEISFSHIDS